ncbi:hypothetical protein LEN26_007458 [Aphanomyces euteiches]|nr:hypothetical protein AeMF1_003808 [Aphanomyces euteiches]KAH9132299.1 hypothetical protein LEN26_007458 [Aphanomyces euteiches]KAH9188257.1 hypothetical protein AeNC1_009773 [Aphanomyces euteiches]
MTFVKAWLLVVLLVAVSVSGGSRFLFSLQARSTDCFYELLDTRTTSNRLLVRFEVVDGTSAADAMDVRIETPTGRTVASWTETTTGYWSHAERESGLYKFCFVHRGTSSKLAVFVNIEFLTATDRSLTIYPTTALTVTPLGNKFDRLDLDVLAQQTSVPSKGLIIFSIQGMSLALLANNATMRHLVSISIDTTTASQVFLTPLLSVPSRPFEWRWLDAMQQVERQQHDVAQPQSVAVFDVSAFVREALLKEASSVAFLLHSNGGHTRAFSMATVAPDHWPLLTVEAVDQAVEFELRAFQSKLWVLRGQLSLLRHHERVSHQAAASTQPRLFVSTVVVDAILIAIGIAQVVYVNRLLR